MRQAAGWGFLLFVGVIMIIGGIEGRVGALMASILTPAQIQSKAPPGG